MIILYLYCVFLVVIYPWTRIVTEIASNMGGGEFAYVVKKGRFNFRNRVVHIQPVGDYNHRQLTRVGVYNRRKTRNRMENMCGEITSAQ